MKPTAQLLGLLFASLSLTALGADTPIAPAATPPAAPAKAETAVVTPPATTAPAPFSPLVSGAVPEAPANPDVLELPKMVVKQKPRPRLTPEIMVTRQAYGELLAKQKYSALDLTLNKFTLPLFGTSLAERALEDEAREKKQLLNLDVLNMVKALETVDPTEAKSLKEAVARP